MASDPNKRVRTHGADILTGWDAFWGTVWPRYELLRIARKMAKTFGPSDAVQDMIFTREGKSYLVVETDSKIGYHALP